MFQSLTHLNLEDRKENQILCLLVMYKHQKRRILFYLFDLYKLNGNYD